MKVFFLSPKICSNDENYFQNAAAKDEGLQLFLEKERARGMVNHLMEENSFSIKDYPSKRHNLKAFTVKDTGCSGSVEDHSILREMRQTLGVTKTYGNYTCIRAQQFNCAYTAKQMQCAACFICINRSVASDAECTLNLARALHFCRAHCLSLYLLSSHFNSLGTNSGPSRNCT